MTINFRFKKYLKYFLIFLLCYICMHSFTNVKAWSNLDSQYIVNYTNENNSDLGSFLVRGDFDTMVGSGLISSSTWETYFNSLKQAVITKLNYSTWETFLDSNYYIADLWIVSGTRSTFDLNFYYCDKNSSAASLFNLSMATTIRRNSTPTGITSQDTYYTQFGAIYRTNSFRFQGYLDLMSNGVGTEYGSATSNNWQYNTFGQRILSCSSNSTNCVVTGYNSNSKVLTIDFRNSNNYFSNHFVDTNKSQLDIYFAKVNAMLVTNDYVFQKAIVNNNLTQQYNLVEPIAQNIIPHMLINKPIIQSLTTNSNGISYNTIQNALIGLGDNYSISTVCSNVRPFVNKVCYLYGSDLSDTDKANSEYFNQITFFKPSDNTINFSQPYYIISFRVYTGYNLDILDISYTTTSTGNSPVSFNILSKKVVDYTLYRDYIVVVEKTTSGLEYLNNISVNFSSLNNFITSIPNDYSFGSYDTIKISSYSQQPTSTEIEQEINNNPLSSISNNDSNSFFSNFKINDRGLSSIVLLPLNFISNFKNTTCSSITLPIPHLSNMSLPCVSSIMNNNVPTIWSLYKIIINGFIIYKVIISLFGDLKNIYKPDNDRIEVLDL